MGAVVITKNRKFTNLHGMTTFSTQKRSIQRIDLAVFADICADFEHAQMMEATPMCEIIVICIDLQQAQEHVSSKHHPK